MSGAGPVVFYVAGYETCSYYVKARAALQGVEILFPSLVKVGEIINCKSFFLFLSFCVSSRRNFYHFCSQDP